MVTYNTNIMANGSNLPKGKRFLKCEGVKPLWSSFIILIVVLCLNTSFIKFILNLDFPSQINIELIILLLSLLLSILLITHLIRAFLTLDLCNLLKNLFKWATLSRHPTLMLLILTRREIWAFWQLDVFPKEMYLKWDLLWRMDQQITTIWRSS